MPASLRLTRFPPLGLACLLACVMAGYTHTCAADGKIDSLDSLRWNYRVILVFARKPGADHAVSTLEEFRPGVEDRDIAWFVLDVETIRTNYEGELDANFAERLARAYFRPVPAETSVVLIGKDGLVKSRSADLDLEKTFATIDRMPMRRQEMRGQKDGTR